MATLDISIVVFCLAIVMFLDLFAVGMRNRWSAFLGFAFAISSIAYFVANYNVVGVTTAATTFTIPFELFISAWVVLPILLSLILIITVRGR